MLSTNYLKVAVRTLLKHKGFSALNLLGLCVGMAACLLILLFIRHEYAFDAFHTRADRIVRLNEVQSFPGITPQHVALSMYPMGPNLQADYPEVAAFTRVAGGPRVVTVDAQPRTLERSVRVDPAFFDLFDFEVLAGDPAAAFENPNTVALTASTAQALFGTADAVGLTLAVGEEAHEVAAVLADVPDASHLQFDALFSIRSVDDAEEMDNWGSNWLVTYLLLAEGSRPEALEAKLPAFKDTYMSEESRGYYELYLQPLRDVHLGSAQITHDYRNWKKFDQRYVTIFGVLALFVLAIACINFTNLSTARAAARAKEVGIRKTVGAGRGQLSGQFLGESVLMAMLALAAAVGLTAATLPLLNDLSRRSLHVASLAEPAVAAGILGAALLVGLLAGVYPALFLSAFEPVRVLKGRMHGTGRKTPFRNVLVVTQFAVAIALIVGTAITVQQLRFMQTRDIGFDREEVMVVPMSPQAEEHYALLKQELRSEPSIVDVTASIQRLGNNLHQWGLRAEPEGGGEAERMSISNLSVDFNYLSFYGMELRDGRAFSEERGTDRGGAFIVNEAMVDEMGWTEPVGKRIGLGWADSLGTVIGVVADFNFNSLHHRIEPLALSVQDFGYSELSVRAEAGRVDEAVAAAERVWGEVVTDRPFTYEFLDDHFAWLYESDRQVSRVVGVVAVLAILIACLGLFGLAAVTTEQRTKEIGIRKVLGASAAGLVLLLSREFARLVGIAFVIAAPIAYLVLRDWLAEFPYRVRIGWEVFLLAGVAALLVALATVSYRAVRTARANPVEALRYE